MRRNFRVFEDVVPLIDGLRIPDSGFHLLGLSFNCQAKNTLSRTFGDSHIKRTRLLVGTFKRALK